MTANPNWKEIVDALLLDQKSSDCPDSVAYVSHLKQQFSCMKLSKKGSLVTVLHMSTLWNYKNKAFHMCTLL